MPRKTQITTADERKQLVAAFKALSNDNRLAVFEQIRSGRGKGAIDDKNHVTVCTVAENFDISLSTISHHIKELKAAGLVHCEKRGQYML